MKKPLRSCWLLSLAYLLTLSASSLHAQTLRDDVQVTVPDEGRFAEIRTKVADMVQRGEIPSMALAVARDGAIIWEEAFGWADRENQIKATPQTVYPVGSLSKSIMATGVMTLVEQGQVDLDDPVVRLIAPAHLPTYEGNAADIKVWHLLNMAAGIPHGWMIFSNEEDISRNAEEKDALLQHIGKVVFPPGEVYHYSNFSMGLTEWIIERITGRDVAEYMRSEVFHPLGMNHTGIRIEEEFAAHVATGYSARMQPIGGAGNSYTVAPGGLGFYSSVHDLILYGMFHLKNRLPNQQQILSDATLDRMHYFSEGPDTLFALGWFTGEKLVSNGRVRGANSRLTLVPSQDLAVACQTNMTSPVNIADQICDEITALFIPNATEKETQGFERYMRVYETPYEPQAELLGVWSGRVETDDGALPVSLVFEQDSTLHIQLGDQVPSTVEDVSFNAFSFLRGRFRGVLQTYPSQGPEETDLRLTLRLDQDRLYGYASAPFSSDRGAFSIPVYIVLERQ